MKRIFFLFLILLSGCVSFKMTPISDVPDQFRSEYREASKAAKEAYKNLERRGWDIILDPIESVPTEIHPVLSASEQTNWGERILLPGEIRARLKSECKYKVHVKIADTGGKQTHTDLQRGQQLGRNYSSSTTLDDVYGHGTHVAGIAFADGFGMLSELIDAGLVTWTPIKVLADQGQGSFSQVANMINSEEADNDKRIQAGESVIFNGSFAGGTIVFEPVDEALERSVQKGVMYVFAAGNSGGAVNYPGKSKYAITASSLDQSMKASNFSSRGPEVDQANPGAGILSTYKNNGYASLSGTSMASPFLASLCAIAKAKYGPAIPDYEAMKAYLAKVSSDLPPDGRDDLTGWGIAYVRAILDTAPGGSPPPPPPPPPSQKSTITLEDGQFTMTWKRISESTSRILIVPYYKIRATADGDSEKSYDIVKNFAREYFQRRVIVVPDDMDSGDATFWTGRFMQIIAKSKGIDLTCLELHGNDGAGRNFIVTNFELQPGQLSNAQIIDQ